MSGGIYALPLHQPKPASALVRSSAYVQSMRLAADDRANEEYYRQFYSTKDILFDKKGEALGDRH